jgi:hypothetical protein
VGELIPGVDPGSGPGPEDEADRPRGSRRRKGRRTPYTDELEREDSMIHRTALVTVVAGFAAAFAGVAYLALALLRR